MIKKQKKRQQTAQQKPKPKILTTKHTYNHISGLKTSLPSDAPLAGMSCSMKQVLNHRIIESYLRVTRHYNELLKNNDWNASILAVLVVKFLLANS